MNRGPILPMNATSKIGGKSIAASAAAAIALALGAMYVHEGGYVNDPHDPGGETNMGVTKATARESGFTGSMRNLQKHCEESASEAVCADRIYLERYIERPGFTPLFLIDPPVADEVFNTAVNMGPTRPSRWLQASIGELGGPAIPVDGKVGLQTIGAYVVLQTRLGPEPACRAMLKALDAKQRAEYDRLVANNPKLAKFYKGWIHLRLGNVDPARCKRSA